MEVKMKMETLQNIVQQSLFLGMVQYQSMIRPEDDKVKQREAVRYLKRRGYEPKCLKEWTERGYIHRRKTGDSPTSPVMYSILEIQRHITAIEMKKGNITYYQQQL